MSRWISRLLTVFLLAAAICVAAVAATANLAAQIGAPGVILIGLAAAAILTVVWLLMIHTVWTRPLGNMTKQAARIAQSNWSGQVALTGTAEVREVFEQFNQAASLTHRQFERLQHEQADLHALVDALPDPIVASDRQGKLILMNPPAARLLRLTSIQALNQKIVSVISDEPVVELFDAVAQLSEPTQKVEREVHFSRSGQTLTCQAVAARTSGGGALVVFRDVTETARAMQMKTDFVANASHELRTPITAIKIAFETLNDSISDDPEQTRRCMAVIAGHLQRLEDMLRDLLDLSRMEGPEAEPAMTMVPIPDLFDAVRGAMTTMARQKQITLNFHDPSPQALFSDARMLNLILKNLVENAVKYTPADGTVTVRLESEGDNAVMSVADTGIGIAPEHIDRVFERFYQVDSARSGSAGRGTGLGLAIVKHAVHALGGQVKLESRLGTGTTVTCTFPQRESLAMQAAREEQAEAVHP